MTNNDTGSRAIQIMEAAYNAAMIAAPDLPPVTFTLKASGRNRNSVTLGHFAPSRYQGATGDKLHEICLTGDAIRRGPVEILTTILHEAAHALAKARGVKDTSRQGRYHNLKFVEMANVFGLEYPHRYGTHDDIPPRRRGKLLPDDTIGYSAVVLPERNYIRWQGVLDIITKDFPFEIGRGEPRIEPRKPRYHQYVAFPEHGELRYPRWDLVQLAPLKYERIAKYMAPHVTVMSKATQMEVESYLDLYRQKAAVDERAERRRNRNDG